MKKSLKNADIVLVILLLLFWGGSVAVTKELLTELDTFQIALYSRIIGICFLAVAFLQFRNRKLPYTALKKSNIFKIMLMSIIGISVPFMLSTAALKYSSPIEVTILIYLWPLFFVLSGMIFYKEKFSKSKIFSILISLFGAFLVITGGKLKLPGSTMSFGYLLAVSAALLQGVFASFIRFSKLDGLSGNLLFNLTAVPFFLAVLLIFSEFQLPTFSMLFWLIILGGLCNGAGYVIYIVLLGKEPAMANIVYLVPFVNILFLNIFFASPVHISAIIGLVLILVSIGLQKSQKLTLLLKKNLIPSLKDHLKNEC